MRIYLLPILLSLLIIPLGFAYAESSDSTKLAKVQFSAKKACCYNEMEEYDGKQVFSGGGMVYESWWKCKNANDHMNSVFQLGNDPENRGGNYPAEAAKRIYNIRCESPREVCGYADADVNPPYNKDNCK